MFKEAMQKEAARPGIMRNVPHGLAWGGAGGAAIGAISGAAKKDVDNRGKAIGKGLVIGALIGAAAGAGTEMANTAVQKSKADIFMNAHPMNWGI